MSGWLNVCGKVEIDVRGLYCSLFQSDQIKNNPNYNQSQILEQQISQLIKSSYIETFGEKPCLDNSCTFVFDVPYSSKVTTPINKRHNQSYKTNRSSRLVIYVNTTVCDHTIVSGEKFVETLFEKLKDNRCVITNKTILNVIGEGNEATLYVGETKYSIQLED